MAAQRRRPVTWHLGCATGYENWRRRRRGSGCSSPRLGCELRRRAGTSAARLGGGVGTKLAVRSVACSSGLRISTGRRGVELRRWPRGQEGPGINGGEQLLDDRSTCGGDDRARFRRGRALGPVQMAREASWMHDGASAVLGRAWEAVAWPVCGGAGRSARRSGVVAVC